MKQNRNNDNNKITRFKYSPVKMKKSLDETWKTMKERRTMRGSTMSKSKRVLMVKTKFIKDNVLWDLKYITMVGPKPEGGYIVLKYSIDWIVWKAVKYYFGIFVRSMKILY